MTATSIMRSSPPARAACDHTAAVRRPAGDADFEVRRPSRAAVPEGDRDGTDAKIFQENVLAIL